MDRRNGATPMDYQWESGHGPVDLNSPFLNASRRNQRDLPKKRTHSAFESPKKPSNQSLREPVGQSFLFSEKPLPPEPRNIFDPSKFNTPRTTKPEIDFSSGPDTPEDWRKIDAGSEETPSGKYGQNMPKFSGTSTNSVYSKADEKPPSPKKRDSLLVRLFGSPGRGEIQKIPHYSRKSEKIVKKRRAKLAEKRRHRDSNGSDSEHSNRKERAKGRDLKSDSNSLSRGGRTSAWASILTFVESHPHLPHVLSFYAQLLFNFFCVAAAIYLIYSFWATVRADVNEASAMATAEVMAEMASCVRQYNENRCGDEGKRVPALEGVCAAWEECMKKDPSKVGRARVSAQTFARIFNSFVEPISYKAMIFSVLVVFGSLTISNFAFSIFRTKTMTHSQGVYHYPPLPTPQRYPSNGSVMGIDQGYWTPARPPHLDPGPSTGIRDPREGSEVKSLMY